jgi:hypothetical protein
MAYKNIRKKSYYPDNPPPLTAPSRAQEEYPYPSHLPDPC